MDGQKCEHVQCTCYVDLGAFFCGDRCREEARAQAFASPRDACGCKHEACENGAYER